MRGERIDLTYVSYALPERCAGVVVIEGLHDALEAARIINKNGWRPSEGGQIYAVHVPDDIRESEYRPLYENRNRLISGAEAEKLFGKAPE